MLDKERKKILEILGAISSYGADVDISLWAAASVVEKRLGRKAGE